MTTRVIERRHGQRIVRQRDDNHTGSEITKPQFRKIEPAGNCLRRVIKNHYLKFLRVEDPAKLLLFLDERDLNARQGISKFLPFRIFQEGGSTENEHLLSGRKRHLRRVVQGDCW